MTECAFRRQRKRTAIRMLRRCAGAATIALAAILVLSVRVSADERTPLKEETLENGLTLLLWEDHELPLASLWTWYRVGSVHERPGQTGMAHWLEHVTFRDTRSFPGWELPLAVESYGGAWDAYTWRDATGYVESVPEAALERILRLEAARMRECLLTPEAARQERRAILAELAESDNDPASLLTRELMATAYQAHPYGNPILGWSSDIESATREELEVLYRDMYGPQNAVLSLVGDFEAGSALALVERYFSSIPRGEEQIDLRTLELPQEGERRTERPSPDGRGYLGVAFPVTNGGDPDFVPLLLVDALLAGAEGVSVWETHPGPPLGEEVSRLHGALIETGLARWVRTDLWPHRYPALYTILVAGAPGVELARLEDALRQELARVAQGGFAATHLRLAERLLRTALALEAEGPTQFSHLLGFFAAMGNPHVYLDLEARLDEATLADLERVGAKYFRPERMTVSRLTPSKEGEWERGPEGPRSRLFGTPRGGIAGIVPLIPQAQGGGRATEITIEVPEPDVWRDELANGLTLVVEERDGSRTAAVLVSVEAGHRYEPAGKPGLSRLTVETIPRGTAGKTARQLATLVASRGGELTVDSGPARVSLTCRGLTEELPRLLPVLAEMVKGPSFPALEMEGPRERWREENFRRGGDPLAVAEDSLAALLFPPGSPHGADLGRSLTALGADDLSSFYRSRYDPRNTTVIVVGDVRRREVEELVKRYFGDWRNPRGGGRARSFSPPAPSRRAVVTLAGKRTAALAWGVRGPRPGAPDYEAAEVLAAVLGGSPLGGRLTHSLLREQSLAASVRAELLPYGGESLILVTAEARPQDLPRIISRWQEERDRLSRQGVLLEELVRGRATVQGEHLREWETNLARAKLWHGLDMFALSPENLEGRIDRLNWVTTSDVREAARRYLSSEGARTVVVGPWGREEWERAQVSW